MIDLIMAKAHRCPGFSSKGSLFWLPFGFTGLVAHYYFRQSGMQWQEGAFFLFLFFIVKYFTSDPFLHIRTTRLLGEVNRTAYGGDTGVVSTLVSGFSSTSGLLELLMNGSRLE